MAKNSLVMQLTFLYVDIAFHLISFSFVGKGFWQLSSAFTLSIRKPAIQM